MVIIAIITLVNQRTRKPFRKYNIVRKPDSCQAKFSLGGESGSRTKSIVLHMHAALRRQGKVRDI